MEPTADKLYVGCSRLSAAAYLDRSTFNDRWLDRRTSLSIEREPISSRSSL
ncbi:hypothetical protein [Phormidesmis priestleyi]